MIKTFEATGDFAACRAAEAWCRDRGISVGVMQRLSPRGLMVGDCIVAKWRNLTEGERCFFDGTMAGDMRHGPVTIELAGVEEDYPVIIKDGAID